MKSLTRGHLKAGIDSVRATKLRNFWTMLGVIIGVASVVSVVGIGDGIKQQISNQLHHSGGNVIIVRPGSVGGRATSALSSIAGLGVSGTLSGQDANVVSVTPGVAYDAPLSAFTTRIAGDQRSTRSGLVIGTNANLSNLLNQQVSAGSFLLPGDETANVVVLGSQAAQRLFNEDVPLGRSLKIDGQTFLVRGILNPFPSEPLSQDADYNNAVFIPYGLAAALTNNTAPIFEILAQPNNPRDTSKVVGAISRALSAAHGGQMDFTVQTGNQSLVTSNGIVSLLTRLITGVAAISLVVGGIGIMNVMFVSVTERMHEIGIRKAVGATNGQILSQFIIESTLLSLSGGVIGIIVFLVIDVVLRLSTSLQPIISWPAILISTGVSLCIGILFGSVPALKAARKDPITALRAE